MLDEQLQGEMDVGDRADRPTPKSPVASGTMSKLKSKFERGSQELESPTLLKEAMTTPKTRRGSRSKNKSKEATEAENSTTSPESDSGRSEKRRSKSEKRSRDKEGKEKKHRGPIQLLNFVFN